MGAYHDSSGRYRQTEQAFIDLELGSWVKVSSNTPMTAFTNEAAPSMGYALVDSEALGIRWNNDAAPGEIMNSFRTPANIKPGTGMTLHIVASKTGATVGDATTFTVALFNQPVDALHDADADFGGVSGALVGNATAKTVQKVTLAIGASDLGPAGTNVTVKLKPTAGTLGTDDLVMQRAYLEYERIVTPT